MSSGTKLTSSVKLTYSQVLLKNNKNGDSIKILQSNTINGIKKNLKLTKPPQKTMYCSTCHKKVYNEEEELMCYECELDYDNGYSTCGICGDKFEIQKMISAYDTPDLKKHVLVCNQCYQCEACVGCGYLAGASPCRWCRHDM